MAIASDSVVMFPRAELDWQPRLMPVATPKVEVWNGFASSFNWTSGEGSLTSPFCPKGAYGLLALA